MEQATANAEVADLQVLIQENDAAIKKYQLQLQKLLYSTDLVDIEVGNLELKLSEVSILQDATFIENNPSVNFYKQ